MLVQRSKLDQHRLIVPVNVTKPLLRADEFHNPVSGRHCRGLIDTGAQRTVVSHAVIAELQLMRTGHMLFSGIHGPRTHTRYLAGIGLWTRRVNGTETRNIDDAENSLYVIEQPVEIVDMDDNANFELILGFNILKMFSFSFDSSTHNFEMIVKS